MSRCVVSCALSFNAIEFRFSRYQVELEEELKSVRAKVLENLKEQGKEISKVEKDIYATGHRIKSLLEENQRFKQVSFLSKHLTLSLFSLSCFVSFLRKFIELFFRSQQNGMLETEIEKVTGEKRWNRMLEEKMSLFAANLERKCDHFVCQVIGKLHSEERS